MTSREQILRKLRAARAPFPDAPPRPRQYQPVTQLDDDRPAGLLARFIAEAERLDTGVQVVNDEAAASAAVMDLLRQHKTTHLLAWDFAHIPVGWLREMAADAGIEITVPDIHDEFRAETLAHIEAAQVGLTGADAALAATGTLVLSAAPGKPRIPSLLPPVHIAVIRARQIVPRLESWVAQQRAAGMPLADQNVCLVSGPSRTADIEKNLVLGMHGPGTLYVVIINSAV